MKLSNKIALTTVSILLFALVVTTLLNYYKYQGTLRDLVRSRFVVTALDLKNTVENSINLGLPLSQTQNIQELIDRIRAGDPQILSVEVFELQGDGAVALFHSDSEQVGHRVPDAWLATLTRSPNPVWEAPDQNAFMVGTTLVNSFDKRVGGIALRYSKTYLDAKIAAMFRGLGTTAAMVLGVGTVLALIGVFLLFRSIRASFERMTVAFGSLFDKDDPALDETSAANDLELRFVHFHRKTHMAIENLLEFEETIHQAELEGQAK